MPRRRKPLATAGDLYIAWSPLGGRGVFAGRAFQKGELIERCPYLRLDADDVDGLLNDYVFDDGADAVVLPLGYGMLYNHASPGNLEHYDVEDDTVFEYYATRDIAKNEELCLDYGTEWWDTRELSPLD